MDEPIYKIFLNRFREAYYQLSDEERNRLLEQHDQATQELGIKFVALYDTSWSTEQWDLGGVTEYPSIEAVQELRKRQEAMNWFRYIDSVSVLGTKMEIPSL